MCYASHNINAGICFTSLYGRKSCLNYTMLMYKTKKFNRKIGIAIKVRKQVASHLAKKLLVSNSTGSIVSDHKNTI